MTEAIYTGDIAPHSITPQAAARLLAANKAQRLADGLQLGFNPNHAVNAAAHVPRWTAPIITTGDVIRLSQWIDGHKAVGSVHASVLCSLEALAVLSTTDFPALYRINPTPDGFTVELQA